MRFESRLLGGDSVEHACDTVGDIVADHIFNKEHRQPNTDDWEDKVEPVGSVCHKTIRQQVLYQGDKLMKNKCCKGGKDTDGERQQRCHLPVGEIVLPPRYDLIEHHYLFIF